MPVEQHLDGFGDAPTDRLPIISGPNKAHKDAHAVWVASQTPPPWERMGLAPEPGVLPDNPTRADIWGVEQQQGEEQRDAARLRATGNVLLLILLVGLAAGLVLAWLT